jgi:hypothetical protein
LDGVRAAKRLEWIEGAPQVSGDDVSGDRRRHPGLEWIEGAPQVSGFGERPLLEVLGDCIVQRALDAQRMRDERSGPGVTLGFSYAHRLSVAEARAYGSGRYDEEAFARIFSGLVYLDFEFEHDAGIRASGVVAPHNAGFELLALFGASRPIPHPVLGEVELKPDPRWPAMLMAGRTTDVLAEALRRMRQARLNPPPLAATTLAAGNNPQRLATGLILPHYEKGLLSVLGAISETKPQSE